MIKRELQMALPHGQSAFLWGARQTGKSSFLHQHFPDAVYYDLLDTHELSRLSHSPYLLREEILALDGKRLKQPIIIDEIQKVPLLLNEVHWLIENKSVAFILCGSSARRLKTQSNNLLGGRAWQYHCYPFSFIEIKQLDLLKAFRHGLIPKHYLSEEKYIREHLQAYVDIYLTDEIRQEGLVRNLPGFARFLDLAGLSNGEMINVSNIARDCHVSRSTVQEYYQILIDTLIGYFIYPYNKKIKREVISATPKFYLFDVGVANYLAKQTIISLKGPAAGRSFEHYLLMELLAFRSYRRKQFTITYWRTKTGLEVDFILDDAAVALEIKLSEQVHKEDLKGLLAFVEEHPNTKPIVISQDKRARQLRLNDKIEILILPWQNFLERLWDGEIV